jgi:flagellar biosynthesis chaperone FliJ
MKPLTLHRKLLLVLMLCLAVQQVHAQGTLKTFKDSSGTSIYSIFRGDTLFIQCDTAFILNKYTFNIYKKFYEKTRQGNSSFTGIMDSYESMIRQQDTMLKTKEIYYQQMKQQFDSLSGSSLAFMDKTSNSLQGISSSLDKATSSLVETQKLLEDSRKMLEEERKKRNARTLKFGIGGAVIGALITALIMAN